MRAFADHGLLISENGKDFYRKPYRIKKHEDVVHLEVEIQKRGELWIATTIPYTAGDLRKLLEDMKSSPHARVTELMEDGRTVPVVTFGAESGQKKEQVHYMVCGEDMWETAGMYFADCMIRKLAEDKALREKLTANAEVRIVPVVSPYSKRKAPAAIFVDENYKNGFVYAAAKWGEAAPRGKSGSCAVKSESSLRRNALGS